MLVPMFRAAVKYMQVLVPNTAASCRASVNYPSAWLCHQVKHTLPAAHWIKPTLQQPTQLTQDPNIQSSMPKAGRVLLILQTHSAKIACSISIS